MYSWNGAPTIFLERFMPLPLSFTFSSLFLFFLCFEIGICGLRSRVPLELEEMRSRMIPGAKLLPSPSLFPFFFAMHIFPGRSVLGSMGHRDNLLRSFFFFFFFFPFFFLIGRQMSQA